MTKPIFRLLAAGLLSAAWTQVGGCREPAEQVQAMDARLHQSGTSFDLAFVTDPALSEDIAWLGRKYARRIEGNGAFRANVKHKQTIIQRQRRAWDVVMAGVAARDAGLVGSGLDAIAWGLDQAQADGSFPLASWKRSDTVLPQSFFLQTAGRSLLLVRSAAFDAPSTQRAAAMQTKYLRAVRWLASSPGLAASERDAKNTNQLFVEASALAIAAMLGRDDALAERARAVARAGLSKQQSDGVFPENDGFDSNYQLVSLYYLAQYAALLDEGAWRTSVLRALGRGVDRFVAAVDPQSGRIVSTGNTRTMACGIDGDKAAERRLRIRYLARLLGRTALATLADRVGSAKQGSDHIADCKQRD